MANYNVDIELAIKGGDRVNQLTRSLNKLNREITVINGRAAQLNKGVFRVASIENYSRAVSKAERALRRAAQGTDQERRAVTGLVTAMELENKARQRKNFLIAQEIASRRRISTAAAQYATPIGPQAAPVRNVRGLASPIGGTVNMPGSPAALAAAARGAGGRGGRGGGRLGSAVSGALIGGAFPLLFGQGGAAATGGAIGGLLGGLAGPGGSFAGSLVGTLLGDIAGRGQQIKQLAQDIGFSAQQTKLLSDAFKIANTDVEKFVGVIQNIRGLGFDIEDQSKAIRLVTELTNKYGGSFEKVGNAITSALESGKVGQGTLNQLTSQGIDIQGALASKYKVSRDAILTMAKDGDISVQDLVDTLVDMGNKGTDAAKRPKSAMDNLRDSVSKLSDAVTALASKFVTAFGPVFQWLTDRVTDFINAVSRAISRFSDLMQGGRMAQATLFAERAAQTATQQKFGIFGRLTEEGRAFYETQKQAELKKLVPGAFTPTKPPKLETFKAPSQFVPSETSRGSEAAAAKAAAALEKRINKLKEEAALTMRTAEIRAKIRQAEIDGDNQLALRLKYEEDRAKVIGDTQKALVGVKDVREQDSLIIARNAQLYALVRDYEYDISELQKDRDQAHMDALKQHIVEQYKLNTAVQAQLQLAGSIANIMGQSMANAFDLLITGAENWSNSLRTIAASVLQDIARQLIQIYLIEQAVSFMKTLLTPFDPSTPLGAGAGKVGKYGTFGPNYGIPQKALGGAVSAGQSYLVGEKGPELFMPGAQGNIIPNSALGGMGGGGIVVNVDAKGSTVEGNGDQANQLGKVIGAAIQQELIKQKKPGGLLA